MFLLYEVPIKPGKRLNRWPSCCNSDKHHTTVPLSLPYISVGVIEHKYQCHCIALKP